MCKQMNVLTTIDQNLQIDMQYSQIAIENCCKAFINNNFTEK
jgi:hypothetical protein